MEIFVIAPVPAPPTGKSWLFCTSVDDRLLPGTGLEPLEGENGKPVASRRLVRKCRKVSRVLGQGRVEALAATSLLVDPDPLPSGQMRANSLAVSGASLREVPGTFSS